MAECRCECHEDPAYAAALAVAVFRPEATATDLDQRLRRAVAELVTERIERSHRCPI